MDKIKKLYQQLEKLETDAERIEQLVLIANRFMYIDLDRFEVLLNEVKELATKSGSDVGMYHYHDGIGRLKVKRMDNTGALESFATARELAKKLDDKKLLAVNAYSFCIVNVNLGNFAVAQQQAEQSVNLLKKLPHNETNLSIAYCYLAITHECLGDFDAAEAAYNKSIDIAPDDADMGTLTGCMVNYAVLKTKKKEYDEALEIYLNALDLMERSGNKLGIVQALINIGEVYFLQGDNNSALTYCVNGLKLLKHVDNKKALMKAYVCLADIYISMNGLKEAEQKLNQAMELLDGTAHPEAECHINGSMGELLLKRGQTAEALPWLTKANDIANSKGLLELRQRYQAILRQTYKV